MITSNLASVPRALKIALAESVIKDVCVNPYDVHGDGSVMVRCNNRARSVCPSCSRLYTGDWAAIARSGVFDEDRQPYDGYAWALVTLTAPSFGPVHAAPHRLRDQAARCQCGTTHDFGDPIAGLPLYDDYDYHGTMQFNDHMPRLFSRTMDRWRRRWGSDLGYFAVTEAQRRGTMHKHLIVRYPSGLLNPLDLLAEAADAYTATWDGNVIEWGAQMDAQRLDVADSPDAAARSASYLIKSVAYTLKDVDHVIGDVSPATRALMEYAKFDYRCSAECSGAGCRAPIHDDLAGSERPLSYSRSWSLTRLTRAKLREQRQAYMEAMTAAGEQKPRTHEGMSEAELWDSRHARRWRREVELKRQREARERWEAQHAEAPEPYLRT